MEKSCWFVESRIEGKFGGWWSQPAQGIGGWLTENPNEAKKYTYEEAQAVAIAMNYFPTPFGWSNWVATEHVFVNP